MDRITGPTVETDKFGDGKHGFTAGNAPGGIPATIVSVAWLDGIQEEFLGVIEAESIEPDADDNTQFLEALDARYFLTLASLGIPDLDQVSVTASGELRVGDGSASAPSLSFASDTDMGFYWISANVMGLAASGVERFRFGVSSSYLYLSETSNANNSEGNITQNSQNGDGEINTKKSSDIAHGVTGVTETDTYGFEKKRSATNGGLQITGIGESGANTGLFLEGIAGTDNTTHSTSAIGYCHVNAAKINSTTIQAAGAGATLFVIDNNDLAQWLCDAEGDTHYNGSDGAGAWDDYHDVELLDTFRHEMVVGADRNFAKRVFSNWTKENAQILHDTGVITMNEDGKHFVSTKGLNALIIDTIRQEAAKSREAMKVLNEMIPGFGMKLTNALHAQSLPAHSI
jgi:hypothetical protein